MKLTNRSQRLQINEFATDVTQNTSELKGRLWKSKLFRIRFLVRSDEINHWKARKMFYPMVYLVILYSLF